MRILCPNEILSTIEDIEFHRLQARNIRGLLLDLDNTLARWDSNAVSPNVIDWIARAKASGFQVCLLSNSFNERVTSFAKQLDIPAVSRALKPRRKPFYQALHLLNLPRSTVAMVGDQLFTDILGGNRIGLYTILLTPLAEKELRSTRIVRRLEQRVLRRLAKKGMLNTEAIRRRLSSS